MGLLDRVNITGDAMEALRAKRFGSLRIVPVELVSKKKDLVVTVTELDLPGTIAGTAVTQVLSSEVKNKVDKATEDKVKGKESLFAKYMK